MTTRVLPPDEWSRLADTELGPMLAAITPGAATVVVAEDESGAAIGCWALVTFVHLEGMWVRPDHRGKASVLKRMWNTICDIATDRGICAVYTGAADPMVAKWITNRGGSMIPCDSFVLPLKHVGRA